MDKRKILYWQIGAIVFTWVVGTLLHFTYEWSGENNFVGIFSAINESTWEHLKLSFFPMLLFSFIEGIFLYRKSNNYIEAKAIAIFLTILLITGIFYTYTGVLGTNFAFINILSFYISVAIGEWIAYRIMIKKEESTIVTKVLSGIIVLFLLICFIAFTFNPPEVNYFKDPITEKYGIMNK